MTSNKPIGLEGAFESFQMYDPLGNCAASAIFKTGETSYEVYFWDFNSNTPRRIVGTLGRCKSAMNHFFYVNERKGFVAAQDFWTPRSSIN